MEAGPNVDIVPMSHTSEINNEDTRCSYFRMGIEHIEFLVTVTEMIRVTKQEEYA